MKSVKCLLFVFLFAFFSCQPKEKFDWSAGISAPKFYGASPFVEFFYKGKSIAGASANIGINPGWGMASGGFVGGEKYKEVPDSMAVSWLCGTDRYYYKGFFKLPRAKMLSLFREKIIESDGREVVSRSLVAGVAPGGNVCLWMKGGSETSIEIGRFKAKNTGIWMENDPDYDEYWNGNRETEKMRNSETNIYRYLHGLPYSVWEKSEPSYSYDIGFSSEEDKNFYTNISGISKSGSYIFFNQEVQKFSYLNWKNNAIKYSKHLGKDKVPVHFSVQWISEDDKEWYEGEIVLPTNFQAIYENFQSKYKVANIIFVMDKIDKSVEYTFGSIWLQNPLSKEKIMNFRLAKLDYITRKYPFSKYSLPKGYKFPTWAGREKIVFPTVEYWQEE